MKKGIKGLIEKTQPRDVIAVIVLIICFGLIANGHDGWLAGITAAIVGYYFSKRTFEERNR